MSQYVVCKMKQLVLMCVIVIVCACVHVCMSLCGCVHGMPHVQVNIVMTVVQGLNLLLVIAATSKYVCT